MAASRGLSILLSKDEQKNICARLLFLNQEDNQLLTQYNLVLQTLSLKCSSSLKEFYNKIKDFSSINGLVILKREFVIQAATPYSSLIQNIYTAKSTLSDTGEANLVSK